MIADEIKKLPSQKAGDPLALFQHYFELAQKSEPTDHTAVALATADASGRPAVRMVLLKAADARGFVFFTSYKSRKAAQLWENPHAALCFHWAKMAIQVRVEGLVTRVEDSESDAYFATRPRGSQLAAWASIQSAPLESREELLARHREVEQRFSDPKVSIPRPDFWGGYLLTPQRIEFWAGETFRMHDRLLFEHDGDRWQTSRLFP